MSLAIVALGSNLGDRRRHLVDAIAAIQHFATVTSISHLYESAAVGGPKQDEFLNAAVVIDTTLGPAELLTALHNVEFEHGRVRDIHWGPRTLDLDLIDYEGFDSSLPALQVPHPLALERSFVLLPWRDVTPTWQLKNSQLLHEFINTLQQSDDFLGIEMIDDGEWFKQ